MKWIKSEDLKEGDNLREIGVDVMILLKLRLKSQDVKV
jgi:hypothetical protein